MTWNSPHGQRILRGNERALVETVLRDMTIEILELPPGQSLIANLRVFDSMSACQQLVMLDAVRRYLFEDTYDLNPTTAVMEGTAAAIFLQLEFKLEFELVTDELSRRRDGDREGCLYWRTLIQNACDEVGWEILKSPLRPDWLNAIDVLNDQILYDADYLWDAISDLEPEAGGDIKQAMDVPDDYFSAPSLPEPTTEDMIDVIRRLL